MKTKIALIGNPNCGKTTFFNRVTGASEYMGNRSGVTVKESLRKVKGKDIILCDLPGIYSLSGYSRDEKAAIDFLTLKNPDGIINIIDGTSFKRSLYLTVQLLKLNLPVALAVNMKDECDKKNIRIDIKALSAELGVKVFFISSKTGEGIDKLLSYAKNIKRADISSYDRMIKKIRSREEKFELKDREILNANSIYAYTDELCRLYLKDEDKKLKLTAFLDKIFLNKYLAYPLLILIITAVFILTFGKPGQLIQALFLKGFRFLISNPLSYAASFLSGGLRELITDGLIAGIEAVASFLPYLLILFVLIHFLEDCGYMSRIAYICDSFMRRLGLSGKSVIPLILGLGCTTPAIMSARIVDNRKERYKTVFLAPFISCSAKIPVYAMFAGAFFKGKYALLMFFIYGLSILLTVFAALIIKGKNKDGEVFTLELPPYRLPSVKNVFVMTREKIKDFLIRGGTIIAAVSVVVWFLNSYSFSLERTDAELSILASLGRIIAPVFRPLGFHSYQAAAALLGGIAAKETIVSSLSVMLNGIENITAIFNPASALSYMTFVLLYMPCAASFITLKKETDKKWALLSLLFHFVSAYAAALAVYTIFR